MDYSGTYEIISHFGKDQTHGGQVIMKIEGNVITGTATVSKISSPLEEGVLDGNSFSYVMRNRLMGPVKMKVEGTFADDGTFKATMTAPFGTSQIDGKKVSD